MPNTQQSVTPDSFPPEIWLDILTVLRNSLTEEQQTRRHKTIDNIVLVSRRYRDLVQPLLFEDFNITIRRGYWSDWLVPRLRGLNAFFDNQPHAAKWIKSVVILRRGRFKLGREEAALLERVFLRMTNVRALHVSRLNITQAMYAHICQLPALENANIDPIRANTHLDSSLLPYGGLQIRRLRLGGRPLNSESATAALVQLALSPRLQQLEVGAQYLAGSASLLCTTFPEHSFSGLTSLTTAPPGAKHIKHFFHFLASCPNLTELRLEFIYYDYFDWERIQLEGDLVTLGMLPRLAYLRSPLNFAKLLIPGRSITELELIISQHLFMDDLRILSTGSKEILRLDLGPHRAEFSEIIGTFAEMFPRLRSVYLAVYESVSSSLDTFLQDMIRLPNLECLHIKSGLKIWELSGAARSLAVQKQCLDTIRANQSSLKEMSFDWRQTWRWTDGGGWKHYDEEEVEEDYDLDVAVGF